MIYSKHEVDLPKKGEYIEYNVYKDRDGSCWDMYIVKDGFFLSYEGPRCYDQLGFVIDLWGGAEINMMNTGVFLIMDNSFEKFCEFRDGIHSHYTEEVWDYIADCMKKRLAEDGLLLECEMIR